MQFAFTVCVYFAALLLDVLVITALLRSSGFRRYAFVLLYVTADFLTTVVEIQPAFGYSSASHEAQTVFANLYWWDERVMQLLVFTMVISLAYKAIGRLRPGSALFMGIVLATAAFAAITFFIQFDPHLPSWKWMTYWTRDLNFGAAILDLGLWAALIGARDKDYRLLMLSGALGLKFTGGAIGEAFRGMSSPGWQLGVGVFIALCNLACLYIWWQAFRMPEKTGPKSRPRPDSEPATIHRASPQ